MNKDAQGRWKVGMSNTKLKMRAKKGKRGIDLDRLFVGGGDEVKEGKRQAQRQAYLNVEALRRQTAGR